MYAKLFSCRVGRILIGKPCLAKSSDEEGSAMAVSLMNGGILNVEAGGSPRLRGLKGWVC